MYLRLSIPHCIVNEILTTKSTLCLNLITPNIHVTPGAYFRGDLYMEGVFRFKSWFLNAPGLIHGGAYRNFTVCPNKSF